MSQAFVGDTRVPVTMVKVGPCVVTQIKNEEKDGYWALQLGLGEKKLKNINKPQTGHLRSLIKDQKAPRYLKEIRLAKEPELKVGDIVAVGDVFKKGDMVSVMGISKGKGFAGVVKRWHFAGGPKTHGQSDRWRAPGSIGQGTTPGRVLKGKHMAGRMGSEQVTIKNLIIVSIDEKGGQILLSGPVPGNRGGLLTLTKLASGKLAELIEETPQVQIQEGEGGETEEVKAEEVKEVELKEETK